MAHSFKKGDVLAFKPTTVRSDLHSSSPSSAMYAAFDNKRTVTVTSGDSGGIYVHGNVEGTGTVWSWVADLFVLASEAKTEPVAFKKGDKVRLRADQSHRGELPIGMRGKTSADTFTVARAHDFGGPRLTLEGFGSLEMFADRFEPAEMTGPFKKGETIRRKASDTTGSAFLLGHATFVVAQDEQTQYSRATVRVEGSTADWYAERFERIPTSTAAAPVATPFNVEFERGVNQNAVLLILSALRALGFEMPYTDTRIAQYVEEGYRFLAVGEKNLAGKVKVSIRGGAARLVPEVIPATNLAAVLARAAALAPPPAPVAPSKLGDYTVDYRSNGDVKVGCTTVSAADVALIAAKSVEMQAAK